MNIRILEPFDDLDEIPSDDEEFSIFGKHGRILQEIANEQRKQWNLKDETTKLS